MQMHFQKCVARAQCPAIRQFQIRGDFAAFRCAIHQIPERDGHDESSGSRARLENFRPRLQTFQMVVVIEKRRHIDGKPPVGLRSETRLVGHDVLGLEFAGCRTK